MRGVSRIAFVLALSVLNFANANDDLEAVKKELSERRYLSYMKELLTYDERGQYRAQGVPFSVTWTNDPESKQHILVGCVLKGRDLGCLPAMVNMFREFKEGNYNSYQGRITFFVENPQSISLLSSNLASEENIFFGNDEAKHDFEKVEKDRAGELKKLLRNVDLFIQMKQTVSPIDKTFYSFPYDELTLEWARYLRASDTLIVPMKSNRKTMTDYARDLGVLTLSLEILQKKDEADSVEQKMKAYLLFRETVKNALFARGQVASLRGIYAVSDELEKISGPLPKLKNFYLTTYEEPFLGELTKLEQELVDFSPLKSGTLLGYQEGTDVVKTEIKAPRDGFVLHARYPKRDDMGATKEPFPRYLYQVIEKKEPLDLLR
ncbi:MAG: hypothetical protein R3A80_06560 [Bdellovibrionota bacterium]